MQIFARSIPLWGRRPRPHVAGYFRKRRLFFRIRLPSIRSRRFRAPKTDIFKYTLQGGDSWNRRFIEYSCERVKTEVFKYDDVMPRFKARSSAHTIRKHYVWTLIVFKYGGKNLRFRKYPVTCGRGLKVITQSNFGSLIQHKKCIFPPREDGCSKSLG